MQVFILNYVYESGMQTGPQLLGRYETLSGWAGSLAQAGARVTVFQRFWRDERLEQQGVRYEFMRDRKGEGLRSWQAPVRLHAEARRTAHSQDNLNQAPIVVHVNGMVFPAAVRHLRRSLPPEAAIVAQHHAGGPWHGWRGWLQRWGLGGVDGVLFAALDLARPWQETAMIRPRQAVAQVMEGSTWFTPRRRESARRQTGLEGQPVWLWVGRLDVNKDPLTVLAGFEAILAETPLARLYMIYHTETLLPRVLARLASSTRLASAVTLMGQVAHEEIEAYYNSADYFVLGSHHEGSGYALLEAVACGAVPVVTDIPTFNVITGGGACGALWRVGDPWSLHAAMQAVVRRSWEQEAERTRQFFEQHFSYPVIARQALAVYTRLSLQRIKEAQGQSEIRRTKFVRGRR